MKKPRKSSQKIITARIPVALIHQLLDQPENISLFHTLLSAIITAERIRRPGGAAAGLEDSSLHPEPSPEATSMEDDARRQAMRTEERRERRRQRDERRNKILIRVLRDEKPVELSSLFGSGLFTREQERTIDAILNPTVRRVSKLSFEQLRAFFLPLIVKMTRTNPDTLPPYERRHALRDGRSYGARPDDFKNPMPDTSYDDRFDEVEVPAPHTFLRYTW